VQIFKYFRMVKIRKNQGYRWKFLNFRVCTPSPYTGFTPAHNTTTTRINQPFSFWKISPF
jgi:hypothetical protein